MIPGTITGIYELYVTETKRIFLCSAKTNNSLKFNYYVITADNQHEPEVFEILNAIDLFTCGKYAVKKIDKNTPLFKNLVEFVSTAEDIEVCTDNVHSIMDKITSEKKIRYKDSSQTNGFGPSKNRY